ncbi:hypothetical protein AAU57_06600 [Nonlabens sp. YIK11]|uniref:restriction endonuclease subunit S n=1 Tax=Nonlabens sp. YIK11 TaxID=1453349 RepID=UPI0006DCFEED|nr:restriction endonuclease subunit S [Nonlabens sp. YIK11]KQC33027.1 hypothetical protein AAU57_06600 [Nonlabens sp. YIK11]
MGAQKKNIMVPQLRFKEFDGEWERKKFGNISVKVGSGSTPKGGSEVYQDSGIPFIRSQNVIDGKLILDGICISEDINSKMKGSIVKSEDILLNITGGSIGRSCIVPNDFEIGNVNQHVCIIRLNKNNSPKFIQSFISSYKGQKLILQRQTGSGREGLNFQSIRLFNVFIPSHPEQQKIASFLTAVDKKLQQLTTKKEQLEHYKKGVMQQLFSQQLRFKDDDGNDFPDWEKKRFSKYIKLYRGSSPRPIIKYTTTESDGVNWIKIGDTKNSNNYRISDVAEKITKKGSLKSRFVRKGEIILANSMSFGKSYLLEIEGCIYDGWFVLREYEDFLNREYLLHLLNSEFLQKQYLRLSTGGVVQNISSDIVYSTIIICPTQKEQQKIATYLSALDAKIETVAGQLLKTQEFKKGLLQRLFV